MTETLWKFRIYFFVRSTDVNYDSRVAFAQIYVDNGGMETLDDEMMMFDNLQRFSLSGELPAQVFGLDAPAKLEMKDEIKALLDTLPQARYAVVANTDLQEYKDGELILTNFPVIPNGQIVDWEVAKQYLFNEFGLIWIPPAEEEPVLTARASHAVSNLWGRLVSWVKNIWPV